MGGGGGLKLEGLVEYYDLIDYNRIHAIMTSFPPNQRFLEFSSYFCAECQHSQKLLIKNT